MEEMSEARLNFEEEYFPKELKRVLKKYNDGVKVSSDEMEEAINKYNSLFYCRAEYPKYLSEALNGKDFETNQLIWNPVKNKEMASYNICDRLNEIKCPTLIMSGKYDGISVGQAELFNTGIKNSRHVEFINSAHYSHIEQEMEFITQVKGFLKGFV
ncbi:alpha/beta fold hydrolase [Virgibacillus subterraneus]|uniref:alpha/beta fold hydrolase n=1 Tax=Virgibacillus subterraneus TaxID=621109 RepID=UPI000B86D9E9|nr:alpha/beta hydrolase [Virgibacillus subterraneus]